MRNNIFFIHFMQLCKGNLKPVGWLECVTNEVTNEETIHNENRHFLPVLHNLKNLKRETTFFTLFTQLCNEKRHLSRYATKKRYFSHCLLYNEKLHFSHSFSHCLPFCAAMTFVTLLNFVTRNDIVHAVLKNQFFTLFTQLCNEKCHLSRCSVMRNDTFNAVLRNFTTTFDGISRSFMQLCNLPMQLWNEKRHFSHCLRNFTMRNDLWWHFTQLYATL